jgi:hypothetical protein
MRWFFLILLWSLTLAELRAEPAAVKSTQIEGLFTFASLGVKAGDAPSHQVVFTAVGRQQPLRISLTLSFPNKILREGESYRIVATLASQGGAEVAARQVLVYLPQRYGVELPFLLTAAEPAGQGRGEISYLKMDVPHLAIL